MDEFVNIAIMCGLMAYALSLPCAATAWWHRNRGGLRVGRVRFVLIIR